MAATTEPDENAAPGRNQFGTFGGVFTPSILTILGVIMFMRCNFVVGQAGVGQALLILLICKSITLLTSLSIAAIATNMPVRGGGSYYLISRVLGPEFGGAIGLAYFCALALSVPFYCLGFTEALCRSLEGIDGLGGVSAHFQVIAFATAVVLFVVAYVGAGWAIRTQYFIMAFLVLAIIAFTGGMALDFDVARFRSNWGPPDGEGLKGLGLPVLGFWAVFAIYFPAVTGVDAGVNMSGDLRDPGRSIPRGALAALGVGLLVYLVQMLLAGGAFERRDMIATPFQLLQDNALFGAHIGGVFVVLGVFAATLSSALGSYLGAPRVLQAVSRDPILLFLRPFGKGSGAGDEPRRALLFVGVLTVAILLWAGNESEGGALNVVAAIVSMFFLYSYGMMNLAAFVEAFGANPSFRPRFRYFHWATALAGVLGCVVASFLIHAVAAVGAVVVISLLFWYVRRQRLQASFGDARRGFVINAVRNHLLVLRDMPEDSRNWRPSILVFSGNPGSRESLVSYALWMEAGRGFVLLANILVGGFAELVRHRNAAIRQLGDFCRERRLHAFPTVVVADSVDQGVRILLQTASIGPIRPNLAVFGWPGTAERAGPFVEQLHLAAVMGMSLVLIRERGRATPVAEKRIDLWWRGQKNGPVMVILAYLLSCNWEWAEARLRILRVVENEAGRVPAREALESLLATARVRAEVCIIVSTRPFQEVLQAYSGSASCVFLGGEPPSSDEALGWYQTYETLMEGLPTTLVVSSPIGEEILV